MIVIIVAINPENVWFINMPQKRKTFSEILSELVKLSCNWL